MKRKKNRLLVHRLFVLGAGASFSSSKTSTAHSQKQAPLDKDFCKRLRNLDVHKPVWVSESRDYIVQNWKDHLPFENLGLEQAIIHQLGHLEFIDAIHPRRRASSVRGPDYLQHLSHLITFVLRRCKESRSEPYRQLTSKVFPDEDVSNTRDRVITFNYDELFDKHLIERFGVKKVYFDRLQQKRFEVRRDSCFPHPLLIKLHGSVNWRCSEDEFTKVIDRSGDDSITKIDNIWYAKQGTPCPGDGDAPLIIPPLPEKPITQIKLFRFLWTKAYEYLHEAEEIVVCGYSLPEFDRLALSLFGNFSNKKLKQVIVVDPDPSILKKWRDLFRRKNVGVARWTYYEDFSEFANEL